MTETACEHIFTKQSSWRMLNYLLKPPDIKILVFLVKGGFLPPTLLPPPLPLTPISHLLSTKIFGSFIYGTAIQIIWFKVVNSFLSNQIKSWVIQSKYVKFQIGKMIRHMCGVHPEKWGCGHKDTFAQLQIVERERKRQSCISALLPSMFLRQYNIVQVYHTICYMDEFFLHKLTQS